MTQESLTIGMPISSFLPALGGMEVGLHNIAKRLAKLGHRPVVFAPASNVRALRQADQRLPYRIASFPPKLMTLVDRAPQLALTIFDLYFAWARRRYGIDVWHGTMGYPIGVALAHYGRGGRLPALVRCAGQDIQIDRSIGYGMRLDPRVDALVRHWLPQVPLLVAITASVADEYRTLGVSEDRIVGIPNGVSLDRFRTGRPRRDIRRELGLAEDTVVFLSVARNHPKKNLAALVNAANLLAKRDNVPDWIVMIVGKDVPALRNLSEQHGVSARVRLIDEISSDDNGPDGDLPSQPLVDLYRAADVFVFPSLIETFGIAIVEAMAAGLPVIVGGSPGCRDVVDGGRYGIMVRPDNFGALADAMQRVASDSTERERLSALSIERAGEYDWDGVVDKYVAAYRRLLSN